MSQWKYIGAIVSLSIGAALAGTGCLAQNADDDSTDPEIAAVGDRDINALPGENTGEADQAFFGCGLLGGLGAVPLWAGLGGLGSRCFPFWGGVGFPFWPAFSGCGGCGFGGCGGCW